MPSAVSYYPDLELIYLQIRGSVNMASLSARIAEWMYELDVPKGYFCLTDLRGLTVVDDPDTGIAGLIKLQARVYEDVAAPEKLALLVDTPIGVVLARLFEQQSDGILHEEVRLFRDELAALAYLGLCAPGLYRLLKGQQNVRRLE